MRFMRAWAVLLTIFGLSMTSNAYAAWNKANTRHFIVYSDGDTRELQRFAEKLEKFDFLLRKITGTPDTEPGSPVVVFTLPNSTAVEKLSGRKHIAGFYNASRRNGYAVVARERKDGQFDLGGEEILFHEYAHHFMLHYFPVAYPPWYVEGFAEFFSVIKFTSKQEIEFGHAPLYRAYGLVTMKPMPVAQLFSRDTEKMNAADGNLYYGTAWLLTHLFHYNDMRRAEFETYLNDIANGKAKDAGSYFAGGLKALDRELRTYLGRRMTASRLTPEEMPTVTAQLSRVEDGHAALMMYEMRQLRGIGGEEAAAFVQGVRTIAVQYPQSAYAQAFLAEVERVSGADDAALAAADRAIALDPKYAPAFATKADILLDRAQASDDSAIWKAALSAIVQGNKADTEDAAPLAQYYRYNLMRGGKMPQVAYDGLLKAYSLVPQYGEYRFMLAYSYASRKKYGQAAALLDPIAFSPHASSDRDYALRMRETLLKAEATGETPDLDMTEKPPAE